ncbi:MAG: alcohol dehydrogenase catalytic domain-containing protein [Janthinobacterium lividum]
MVIKVAAVGVCHSDLAIQAQGPGMPPVRGFPLILGHEIAGHVHELGDGVTGWAVGDAVVVWSGWGDRTCIVCRSGYEHLCPDIQFPGVVVDGGWADHMVVPHADYLVALDDLDPVLAAPLADAGLTSFGAVSKVLPLLDRADSSVVVIGAGGLGQFAIKYLTALTPATVIAVDTEETKRAKALEIGATHAVNSRATDAIDQIRDVTTDKLGVTAVIDFVGIDATLALAAAVALPRGRITLVGINGGALPFAYGSTQQEVELSTSTLGSREDLAEVIRLARENGINAEITRYDLEDVNQALADLAANKIPERGALVL